MTAIGLDIGGTKMELRVYNDAWELTGQQRRQTPQKYEDLLTEIASLVGQTDLDVPLGISLAGVVDRKTGLAVTANLPATGKPFHADLAQRLGRPVTIVNDCRAMALSEAVLGAGRGLSRVMGLVLGTGVGAGFVKDGRLDEGASGLLGEFGHIALPAALAQKHALPVLQCGCGRLGCYETLLSGPGLARLAAHLTGRDLSPPQIALLRHTDESVAAVWRLWCDIAAELLMAVVIGTDPDVVVLGGGLSAIPGICDDLLAALKRVQIAGFDLPEIVLSEGGDATGARGAAWAAKEQAMLPNTKDTRCL